MSAFTNHTEYFLEIKMSNTLIDRVRMFYNFYNDVCKTVIDDIFVTDFINTDGQRQFSNLWFFNKDVCMEVHDFVTSFSADMVPIRRIRRWIITQQDYDFKNPNEKSKLIIKFDFASDQVGEMKATKENCLYLQKIFERYILNSMSLELSK